MTPSVRARRQKAAREHGEQRAQQRLGRGRRRQRGGHVTQLRGRGASRDHGCPRFPCALHRLGITEPADGKGRLCGDRASNEEIVEYMTGFGEVEKIAARLQEREELRLEPTADEVAADERSRLVFGVEPFDPDDYTTTA